MAQTQEGTHVTTDGTELYTKTWKPSQGAPLAVLFFLHGFSDHSNIHYSLFPTLASRNIEVVAFDQRGYGRSVKDKASRGATGPTLTVLADITSVIEAYLPRIKVPIFLMGHSMGGAETLYYAAHGPAHVHDRIKGYIAESPWIGLHPSAQPNKITVAAGRMISKILPRQQRLVDLDPKTISRDVTVGEEFANDKLCHNTGTLTGLAGCFERAEQLASGLAMPDNGTSVLLAHGTADLVTSYDASKRFVENLKVKDKEFKSYDGWYHKLHAEPGGDGVRFSNEVADWILARVQGSGTSNPEADDNVTSKL